MPHQLRPFLLALPFILFAAARLQAGPAEKLTFEKDVRPILKTWCLDCHGGASKLRGKLDLRLRRFAVRGGSNGPAVAPGVPAKSPLLERMKKGEMPPTEKKVPAAQVAIIERWISQGAATLRAEPEKLPPGIPITAEERASWFFQPLRKPTPPAVVSDRIRTPIDAFILAKLQQQGLSFNADADRLTLLRRASLDLIGLPPTPEETTAFLSDTTPAAYEKLIDRLLASPAYGERWGRHWLDPAGYADSDGEPTRDTPRPHAWKYRDHVIRSFNSDKPFDRFLVEQLAGDELVARPWTDLRPEQFDVLTATGFLRMAPDNSIGGKAEAEQVLTDTLKIVSSTLLGLSVGCAQCHDHRYDPIPQEDYYRLRAIFEPALNPSSWRTPAQRRLSLYTQAFRKKAAAVDAEAAKMQADYNIIQKKYVDAAFEKELLKFPADQREKLRAAFNIPANKLTPEQKKLIASNPKLKVTPGVLYQYNQAAADELKKLQAKINAKRAEKPIEDFIAITDEIPGQIPVTRIFHRGDYRQPKAEVKPGDLTIAAPEGKRFEIAPGDKKLGTTGRRLAYARHLTSGTHPLVGRVFVNRLWLHHLGRGIVDTPGDFGVLGQKPTHPELLDFLAWELVRQGWSIKRMHRLIMRSTVYRQSSLRDKTKDAIDSGNALYGRFSIRRLDAEVLRDRILATTGRLDRTLFGPPIVPVEDTTGQVGAPDDKPRRSVYLQVRRSKPEAFLSTFDSPGPELNCDKRVSTTSAPQSLLLMNSAFMLRQAEHFARRVMSEAPATAGKEALAGWISRAWQLAYQRSASADEVDLARRFVEKKLTQAKSMARADAERSALTDLCQQLLASNEFLYVD